FLSFEQQQYTVGNPVQHKFPITAAAGGNATTNIQLACKSALTNGGVAALSAQLTGLDPATCAPLANAPGLFPVNNGSSTTAFTDLNSVTHIDSGLVKIDYHINQHHTVTGMYLIGRGQGPVVDNPILQTNLLWVRSPHAA